MDALVRIKGSDVFTDSLIVASGTNNRHKNVKELIIKYENQFKTLGTFSVSNGESSGGRPEQLIELNEPQASFLVTLLRNSDAVVSFKLALIKEFYRMRKILLERSASEWKETRQNGRLTRRNETDAVKSFVDYARKQGSANAEKYYIHFTNMVNDAVGIRAGERELATPKALTVIDMLEDLILNTLGESMRLDMHYKDVYRLCKTRVSEAMNYVYLPDQPLLPTG